MQLLENVELETRLQIAMQRGEAAIKALDGDFEARAQDYDDDDREQDDGEDYDDEELRFMRRKERRHYRRNMRPGRSSLKDGPRQREALERLQREYVDDFMTALWEVEKNLHRNSRALYDDFRAAVERCFRPEVMGPEFTQDEQVRIRRLIDFLQELREQPKIDSRLRMLDESRKLLQYPLNGLSVGELEQRLITLYANQR